MRLDVDIKQYHIFLVIFAIAIVAGVNLIIAAPWNPDLKVWHSAGEIGPGIMQGHIIINSSLQVSRWPWLGEGITIERGTITIGGTPQRGFWNSRVPLMNYLVIPVSDTIMYTSLTIGADGLPVIAYYDSTNYDLKVLKCGNIYCGNDDVKTILDNDIGTTLVSAPSIAINPQIFPGFPIIAYHNGRIISSSLKLARCYDAACSSSSIITIDSGEYVGHSPSITIGTDGLPVIAYKAGSTADLKVAKCNDPTCLTKTISTVNTGFMPGYYASIAIGADGLPVISHCAYGNGDLRVTKCGNAACSAGNTVTTVDSANVVGYYTSITIGVDGLPVISYYDFTNGNLKVAKCGNAACSAGNTLSTLDSVNNVGLYTSITIGADGVPIISYYDSTNGDLKVAKCGNAACSAGNANIIVDPADDAGRYTSIAIGTSGLPIISYQYFGGLRIANCGSDRCIPYWTRR